MRLRFQIPALDEAVTLERVVTDCLTAGARLTEAADLSLLIVDDGSSDATPRICRRLAARDPRVAFVRQPRRFGLGAAFRTALADARRAGVDLLVHVDGDGQFPLDALPALVAPVVAGDCDIAMASRFAEPKLVPEMPLIRRLGNQLVARVVSVACGQTYADVSCGFRVYSRRAIATLDPQCDFTHTHETLLVGAHLGLRVSEIPIRIRGVREHGASRLARSPWRYGFFAGVGIVNTAMRLRWRGGVSEERRARGVDGEVGP
jgi:glycosyltransferase involved in cell wall biosynthesis